MKQNCVLNDQFGYWLRAGGRKYEGMNYRGRSGGKENNGQMRLEGKNEDSNSNKGVEGQELGEWDQKG